MQEKYVSLILWLRFGKRATFPSSILNLFEDGEDGQALLLFRITDGLPGQLHLLVVVIYGLLFEEEKWKMCGHNKYNNQEQWI